MTGQRILVVGKRSVHTTPALHSLNLAIRQGRGRAQLSETWEVSSNRRMGKCARIPEIPELVVSLAFPSGAFWPEVRAA